MKNKICKICGRELPIEKFKRILTSPDGYTHICKECMKKKRETKSMNKNNGAINGGNPELARFTPRELMLELKARNYEGTLYYTKTIDISKL